MKRLAIDKEEANIVKSDVEAENEEANNQMKEIKLIKDEADKELGEAIPMLL